MLNTIATFESASKIRNRRVKAASSRADFRMAMRQLAGGVGIVALGLASDRRGFTAASIIALPADPPRLMLAVDRGAFQFDRCRCFGVSILAGHHTHLAARFDRSKGEEAFAGGCWHTMVTGAPLLCDALAALDCELEEIIERHSHAIVIGRVVETRCSNAGDALTYWRGGYRDVPQGEDASAMSRWEPILRSRNIGCG